MAKTHLLPNKSRRYKWDTEQVTVYSIEIDQKDYQEKLATVAEALYKIFTSRSEWEAIDLPTDSILSTSHQGNELPNQGTSTSGVLEREQPYEKAA